MKSSPTIITIVFRARLYYIFLLTVFLTSFQNKQPTHASAVSITEIELNGIYRKVNKTEYAYQLPKQAPTGVFILLHGCNHAGTDFFPKSATCEQCIGLPVEVRITKEVLSRDMVPLALTSTNRHSKCWGHEDDFSDMSHIIVDFIHRYIPNHPSIPVYYFGASSGGTYAGMLSQSGRQHNLAAMGAIVEISATRFSSLIPPSHIPTMVFIYMSKDERSAVGVQRMSTVLQSKNVPHKSFPVTEKRVTPDFFTFENVLSRENSAAFVSALKKSGFLTDAGYLKEDPRMSEWRQVAESTLPQVVPGRDSLIADQSALAEMMNLAWASHEMTHEFLHEAIEFIKSQKRELSEKG